MLHAFCTIWSNLQQRQQKHNTAGASLTKSDQCGVSICPYFICLLSSAIGFWWNDMYNLNASYLVFLCCNSRLHVHVYHKYWLWQLWIISVIQWYMLSYVLLLIIFCQLITQVDLIGINVEYSVYFYVIVFINTNAGKYGITWFTVYNLLPLDKIYCLKCRQNT